MMIDTRTDHHGRCALRGSREPGISLRRILGGSSLAVLLALLLSSEGEGQSSVRASVARESVLSPDALTGLVMGFTPPRATLESVTARSVLEPSREQWVARASRFDPETERQMGAELTPEGLDRAGLGSAISPDGLSRLLRASAPTGAASLELSVSSTVGRSISQASIPAGSVTASIQAATRGGEAFLRLRRCASVGSYDFVLHRSVASDTQIRLIHRLSSD